MLEELTTDVLVVGGGTGGVAAALQAARRGAQTILVSEFPWLGGMLTSAGVTAPDGNELLAFQTGLWGAFLRELRQRQPGGLDHAWVSFFTYDPQVGAAIFADWVADLPNLIWIQNQVPLEVGREGDRLAWVRFATTRIRASIIIDGTELGDLLALAEVPYRWGWELQSTWAEPSAPIVPNEITQRYPVQAPTWVVVLQDFGPGTIAPEILPPATDSPATDSLATDSLATDSPEQFAGSWDQYGAESFLNYGRLPGDRFMINWPPRGNDYGEGVDRLVQSPQARAEFLQESRWHSQCFARYIQQHLGRRYGLADDLFPRLPNHLGGGAYALHPYYRESRRLCGLTTVREQDILPVAGGTVAALPMDTQGHVQAIAIGNYPNDHHYPGCDWPLQAKSIRWGGRWTGTPFTIPYGALVPQAITGLLVCDKGISVSHIANGATRLQPTVLGIGQAAGMAAALCLEHRCQPQELPVSALQAALIADATAPLAVIPLFNLPPSHPRWHHWQQYYLQHPDQYPHQGYGPIASAPHSPPTTLPKPQGYPGVTTSLWIGVFKRIDCQDYQLILDESTSLPGCVVSLVTLNADVDQQLATCPTPQLVQVWGTLNQAGNWLLVEELSPIPPPS